MGTEMMRIFTFFDTAAIASSLVAAVLWYRAGARTLRRIARSETPDAANSMGVFFRFAKPSAIQCVRSVKRCLSINDWMNMRMPRLVPSEIFVSVRRSSCVQTA